MNAVLENKLKDLLEESRRQGAPAAMVVTHMLLACYAKGTQNELAKWVSQYTPPGVQISLDINGAPPRLPGEWPEGDEEKEWIC